MSFIAITGALQAAVERGALTSYQVKGGVALELRFPGVVRATRDLDVGMPGTRADRVEGLRAALATGFDHFAFRVRREPRHLERADTVRVEVSITYDGRPLQTIDVDLGPADAPVEQVSTTMEVIDVLAVPIAKTISCVAISSQIAQKIHAGTNPDIVADPRQDRARDIVDIVFLETLGQVEDSAVRAAAEQIFGQRGEHQWPPAIPHYPDSWLATMGNLASELKISNDGTEVVRRFSRTLARILGVVPMPRYEYQFISLSVVSAGMGTDAVPPTNTATVRLAELAREGWRLHTVIQNAAASGYLIAVLEKMTDEGGNSK
ncbi:MAG: nucleotidyl transferase AbiEii/AbiGii toxin family protein [Candidatus Eremiobacteraeota bacterium]|nr:nucleotidyl transferase AbiEii/AbiGii toxin family protein [Candidatus Eremiobacteraeota bacterium]